MVPSPARVEDAAFQPGTHRDSSVRGGGHQEPGYEKRDRISTMVRTGGHDARGNAPGTTACAGRVSRYTTIWQLVASRMLAARQPTQHGLARALQLGSPRVSGMKSLPDMVGLLLSDHDHGLPSGNSRQSRNAAVESCLVSSPFSSSLSLLGQC